MFKKRFYKSILYKLKKKKNRGRENFSDLHFVSPV